MAKDDWRQRGDQARDARDWSAASTAYRKHLASNDRDAGIWVQLGHALKESVDYEGAEQAYEQALRLSPDDADIPLQIGHLMKRMGRRSEAVSSYLSSLRLDRRSPALAELHGLGQGTAADRIVKLAKARSSENASYFQINDLLYFLRQHRTPSGIQRVQLGILIHILGQDSASGNIDFVYNHVGDLRIWLIDKQKLALVLEYLSETDVDQEVLRSKIDDVMGSRVSVSPSKGDSFVILGAFWSLPYNTILLSQLKRRGAIVGVYLYDLIPIYFPEYCVSQLTIDFTMDLVETLVMIDFALAISKHTAIEVEKFILDNDLPRIPVEVVPLAHSLTGAADLIAVSEDEPDWSASTEVLKGKRYVLCVCTIEPRKNHRYLYDIWKSLLAKGVDMPKLVFVGRRGWNIDDFFQQMTNSGFLDGHVVIVHDLSDTELATLYANCLFTAFPSIVEGWGLPVGESLYYGKLCVTSDASSMPEVGGDLVLYVDPMSTRTGLDVIQGLVQNPREIAAWEERIREGFRPRTWDVVARDFCSAVARLAKSVEPSPFVIPATRPGRVVEIGRFARGPQRLEIEEMRSLERLAFADDFYTPEPFGAWMKGDEGRLHVSTHLPQGSEVVVFLEMYGAPDVRDMRVEVVGNGSKPRGFLVNDGLSTLAKVNAETDENGVALIRLRIVGSFDRNRHLPRILGVGLRSFAYARNDDLASRLAVTENYMFDLRSTQL